MQGKPLSCLNRGLESQSLNQPVLVVESANLVQSRTSSGMDWKFRTHTNGFSRPGQPETRQPSDKPSLMLSGTPSNAMAASMSSWRRSSNRSRRTRPPTAAK